MTTARQMLDDLVEGNRSLAEVEQDFRTRVWPSVRVGLTEGQQHGTEDVALAIDNSPDWIEIQAGLTEHERDVLRQSYDQAHGGDRR